MRDTCERKDVTAFAALGHFLHAVQPYNVGGTRREKDMESSERDYAVICDIGMLFSITADHRHSHLRIRNTIVTFTLKYLNFIRNIRSHVTTICTLAPWKP